jgi:putative membrane protein
MISKLAFAAAATAIVLSTTATAGPSSREDFLKDAIRGDNSEIKLGQLAAQSGGSRGVRAYGRTLVADHAKGKAQAAQVAKQLGVDVPSHAMLKADAEYLKLRALSGKSFDREFVSYMIDDHKDDIQTFRQAARSHHGPVGKLAEEQLPTLRKHLKMAEQIQSGI